MFLLFFVSLFSNLDYNIINVAYTIIIWENYPFVCYWFFLLYIIFSLSRWKGKSLYHVSAWTLTVKIGGKPSGHRDKSSKFVLRFSRLYHVRPSLPGGGCSSRSLFSRQQYLTTSPFDSATRIELTRCSRHPVSSSAGQPHAPDSS